VKVRTHVLIEEDLYAAIWEYIKKKYEIPTRKFTMVLNQALREFLENHKDDMEG